MGGIALVSAALHWIAGSVTLSYLVHGCCIECNAARPGPVGCRRGRRWARVSAITLVADEAVHPIRRHYTPSDRVQRDGSGAALHGLGLVDAGMCSASEEDRVQACCR